MRLILCVILAMGLVWGVGGCKKPAGQTGDKIVIGEYGSLTGETATFGKSSHTGLMLAIDEINAAGGVLGKQIAIITEDDQSKADEAVNAVQKLITRDKVVAVIGEVASKRSLAGGGVCQRSKIPMLTPASTNPDVTRIGDHIFRICFTDDFQGPVAARFATKKGWKKVAVLTDAGNDYSKGLSAAFKDQFTKDGGQIVADESFAQSTSKDFRAQLSKIAGTSPEAVYLPAYYTDVGVALRQARELGLKVPFFGGDGWDSSLTLSLGGVADGCFFTNHYSPDDPRPEVQKFIAAYKARYKEIPDAMAILGYDAGYVMADAIRRAGKAEPAAIRDALAKTEKFPGASGTITIDKDRNAVKPIVIVEIQGNRTRMVDSISPQ